MSRRPASILLSLLFIFTCARTYAQVGEHRNDLIVGVTGGYLLNQVSFNPTIKQTMKGGETFGLTIRYTCEKYLSAICSLQGEVNYANMGWKEDIEYVNEDGLSDTYMRDMRYVQVPIFARLAWGKELRGFQYYLQIGPQLSYCLSETEHMEGPWDATTLLHRPNNVKMQYGMAVQRKFEYGLTGGVGMELSTGIGRFSLEGRYYYGLSDIFNNGKKDPFGRSANGAIIIKAGYLFDVIRTKGIVRK